MQHDQQVSPLPTDVRAEHRWLRQFLGDWAYESSPVAGPGETTETFTGTERVRAVGDLWVVAEGEGALPGNESTTTLLTLGFDSQRDSFICTWIGSMMSSLWQYDDIRLDSAANSLTLCADGPGILDQSVTTRFKDVMTFDTPDLRTVSSYHQVQDGTWETFLVSRYRRA